jgi:hypothetical protein
MTSEEIAEHKALIDKMSKTEMAQLYRFAPAGHPYFIRGTELQKYFEKAFEGFTPGISKKIGF